MDFEKYFDDVEEGTGGDDRLDGAGGWKEKCWVLQWGKGNAKIRGLFRKQVPFR